MSLMFMMMPNYVVIDGASVCVDVVSDNACNVPARLGKGQGAKEIGHNLARERPKFGHNPARERNEVWAQFCGRLMKT